LQAWGADRLAQAHLRDVVGHRSEAEDDRPDEENRHRERGRRQRERERSERGDGDGNDDRPSDADRFLQTRRRERPTIVRPEAGEDGARPERRHVALAPWASRVIANAMPY
jgi:hypothetical protein